ncbi:hypothetical protein L5515_001372 [Caenorhabditis briggsae]|uniref:Uncharacterized protein n=1 Tax=Caenorhabditis briggsae TaxID=6238 RepID=A0AAE9E134_CAEBR|nr:hypothetical protein L5515_001372 [Caenorhabditis briggsae]
MNGTTNLTDASAIEKRLEEINETLSSISAKEVLFIITLSFLAVFAAINMCLLILERRKKRKQNSVPQAIVIQPNNAKQDSKAGRNDKSKMSSSGYEKDVLPSKSMKMKVSISPSMSTLKKTRAPSKESTTEDSQTSRTDTSQTEKITKKPPVPPTANVSLPPLENAASADVTTAVEPGAPNPSSSNSTTAPATPTANSQVQNVAPVVPAAVSSQKSESSQSQESGMTSFTVPEYPNSNRSKTPITAPKETTALKEIAPATPTATTLSGASSISTAPSEGGKTGDVVTAKDLTLAKSPMTPVGRTPEVTIPPASIPPVITTTPPPNSEKKI